MGKSGIPSVHVEMIDNLTEEERAEFWAQCALWQAEAVAAQDAEMVADELGRQSDAQVAEDAERDLLVAELA
jgi:diadenosine tetraphosphate (Ap4A) HIT family hydrolase